MLSRALLGLSLVVFSVILLAIGGAAPRSGVAAEHGYSFRSLAKLGDPAPGGGDHEGDFEPQGLNGSGTVTFVSDLEVAGAPAGEGIFISRHGVNTQIVRSGLPAPGTSTTFGLGGVLSPSGLNDKGDVAFGFTLDPASPVFGTSAGVWRYSAAKGEVTAVLLPGDPAPGSTTFRGTFFHTAINNRGEITTVGIIDTPDGNCTDPTAPCFGLGRGVYTFDARGNAAKIAAPGDPAPGSASTFDDAWDPNINDRGDVVFGGHVAGETCIGGSASTLGCFESLYLYRASTGTLSSLVHQGDPAPGGGKFNHAWNGRLNNAGDLSFIGALGDTPGTNGVFLYQHDGSIVTVARPGDSLPGGTMLNTTNNQGAHAINNAGQVAFVVQLDADVNGDAFKDTGVYVYDKGALRTVVRTGTVIPGLGTVAHTNNSFLVGGPHPWPGVHLNDRGQILTQVILTSGVAHVVVATPEGRQH